MARPFKRLTKSYTRDAEALGRLRTHLLFDAAVGAVHRGRVTIQIDALIQTLGEIQQFKDMHAAVKKTG